MAKFFYHIKMKMTFLGIITLLFANCSMPNKEVLPEITPTHHLLHVEDFITRKPPVYEAEEDFC